MTIRRKDIKNNPLAEELYYDSYNNVVLWKVEKDYYVELPGGKDEDENRLIPCENITSFMNIYLAQRKQFSIVEEIGELIHETIDAHILYELEGELYGYDSNSHQWYSGEYFLEYYKERHTDPDTGELDPGWDEDVSLFMQTLRISQSPYYIELFGK